MSSTHQGKSKQRSRHRTISLQWLRIWLPIAIIAAGAFAITYRFVKPAPPSHVVIGAGPKSGKYFAIANDYAKYFADSGITLEVRETSGSGENFKLLNTPDGPVDAAIVQAGSSPKELRSHIQAVAGIYYEPLLVFTRGPKITQLNQLQGKRIAIGPEGSGTRVLASLLLTEAGVVQNQRGTQLLDLPADKAADDLIAGNLDAACFVISPDVSMVGRLLNEKDIHLMSFDHAKAYGRLHPFLSATTLYQGAIDIEHNLPDTDVELVAAPATLVVRDTIHSAIVQLLVRAAQHTNSATTLLASAKTFPNDQGSELSFNTDAEYYLTNPPSILHRTFPFWLASMIDRLIILLLPLLVVLIPLVRTVPPAMKWRVERKLLNRYKKVRLLEEKVRAGASMEELRSACQQLESMEAEMSAMKLPVTFAHDLYELRSHADFVRETIERRMVTLGSNRADSTSRS